jgi:hypothetical protein
MRCCPAGERLITEPHRQHPRAGPENGTPLAAHGRLPSWQQPSGNSTVHVGGDYPRWRWHEGCHNAARLWREIRGRGFAGRPRPVRDWLRRLRATSQQSAGSAPAWKTPSGRRTARLVVAHRNEIAGTERKFVDALIAGSAELAHLIAACSGVLDDDPRAAGGMAGWLACRR